MKDSEDQIVDAVGGKGDGEQFARGEGREYRDENL